MGQGIRSPTSRPTSDIGMYKIMLFTMLLTKKKNDIKLAIEKYAGVTFRKMQPGDKVPLLSLGRVDVGWLRVPPGYIVFLLSVAPEDCVEAVVQVRVDSEDENYYSVGGWRCGSGVVLFEKVHFRTEPAGIPYTSVLTPTSPLGEET